MNASKSQIDQELDETKQQEPELIGGGAVEMKPAGEGFMAMQGMGSGVLDRKRVCMIHK